MFRCPYCGHTGPPREEEKVSAAGWVVFALLVFFCLPLCWLGLFIKEKERRCLSCSSKVG